ADPSLLPRGLSGARPELSRHAHLREGDAQARGLGRAALRRGEAVARAGAVPPPGHRQGEHGGGAGRGGAEPEAVALGDRLGTPAWPAGQPPGGPHRPRAGGGTPLMRTIIPPASCPLASAFFNELTRSVK